MTADKLLVMKRFQIVATFVAISKIVNTRENSRRFYPDCNNLYIDTKIVLPTLCYQKGFNGLAFTVNEYFVVQ